MFPFLYEDDRRDRKDYFETQTEGMQCASICGLRVMCVYNFHSGKYSLKSIQLNTLVSLSGLFGFAFLAQNTLIFRITLK